MQIKSVSNWLFLCCFMVFAMAVIGAVTRLTESGLSITEWKPVTGALPPLTDAEWQRQFALYQNTPEYAAKHFWMDIADFKKIFFWEWLHRLWGRLIGLVYAVPLVWFWVRGQLPRGHRWKFVALLALGGLQGFIGWFMVQSGLIDRPSVSHFRLALHLDMALLLFAGLLWLALDLRRDGSPRGATTPAIWRGWGVIALVAATITWGALVAGLDAGMIYNSFPLMGGQIVPDDFGNPLTSPAGAQFIHRWLAVIAVIAVIAHAWTTRVQLERIAAAMGVMAAAQAALGLGTLLTQVDLHLAAAHQAGAIILLALTLSAQHNLLHSSQG